MLRSDDGSDALYVYLIRSRAAGRAVIDGHAYNETNQYANGADHCAYDNDETIRDKAKKEIVGSVSRSSFSELIGSGLKLEIQESQFSLPGYPNHRLGGDRKSEKTSGGLSRP